LSVRPGPTATVPGDILFGDGIALRHPVTIIDTDDDTPRADTTAIAPGDILVLRNPSYSMDDVIDTPLTDLTLEPLTENEQLTDALLLLRTIVVEMHNQGKTHPLKSAVGIALKDRNPTAFELKSDRAKVMAMALDSETGFLTEGGVNGREWVRLKSVGTPIIPPSPILGVPFPVESIDPGIAPSSQEIISWMKPSAIEKLRIMRFAIYLRPGIIPHGAPLAGPGRFIANLQGKGMVMMFAREDTMIRFREQFAGSPLVSGAPEVQLRGSTTL